MMMMTSPEVAELLLPPDASLRRALEMLQANSRQIVLVCAPQERQLLGTITDGDVRRALLAGAALDATTVGEIMSPRFLTVSPAASRVEVLDIMRARSIAHVPVVDERGQLLGLHTLRELVGTTERENWAVVMAGGKGTRLRPYTESIPKPMVKVAGRPMLERIVYHLVSFGFQRVFLSVNYLAHVVEDYFGDGSAFGCRIEYLRETAPLGTAGCLALLPETPQAPLLVMNGDLVTQADLGRLMHAHDEGGHAATMAVRPYSVQIPFGVADVEEGQVLAIREKPSTQMLVNAGMYVLSPAAIARARPEPEFHITHLLQDCLDARLTVGAHLIEDEWADVGHPAELARVNGIG